MSFNVIAYLSLFRNLNVVMLFVRVILRLRDSFKFLQIFFEKWASVRVAKTQPIAYTSSHFPLMSMWISFSAVRFGSVSRLCSKNVP